MGEEIENVFKEAALIDSLKELTTATDRLIRQLSAARYAYHKQVQHKYRLFMQTGMSLEEAIEKYDKSMLNYDSIIENAINGASQEANEADMAKGFE